MARLVHWRLVFAAFVVLAMVSAPAIHAQDAGTVAVTVDTAAPTPTEAVPIVTTATPVAAEAITPPPAPTEDVTQPPAPTEAATPAPAPTEATVTSAPTETPAPAPTPIATEAIPATTAPIAPVITDPPTTAAPTAAPATSQVPPETKAMVLEDTSSPLSSMRGSSSASSRISSSSLSSASKSPSETTTGMLDGLSSTKIIVICVLGGVGLTIILCLLFVVWRSRPREFPDLDTPPPPDTTIMFPAVPMAAPTAQEMNAWKAAGSSFASRDLPLSESARAKLNATTRSSTEYDLANRPSQIASLSSHGTPAQTPQANRETNASSEQRFSIRGFSELSAHHEDSETDDRYSTSDRYSSGDRYSTCGRYSTSSRLSSEVGRSDSGWFQVPKSVERHRFSSTSSTASSIAAKKHKPVSFISRDLTQTPGGEAPAATDSTTSRTDVPDWYSVIESPTDNDRYTTSSLDSDNISSERESFEL